MRNKIGSDLSLNIVIMAVLLLIVLAILLVVFVNRNREFVKGVQSCSGRGGTCATGAFTDSQGNKVCAPEQAVLFDTDCNKGQNVKVACCIQT